MINRFGRYIFVVLLLLSIGGDTLAQVMRPMRRTPPRIRENRIIERPTPKPNQLQQAKENYISKQLALPPAQTIKFEALYLQYLQERRAVTILRRLNNTDATANGADQVNKTLAYDRELLEIKQHYVDEFSKIMSPDKVSILFKSEQEFDNEAVRRWMKEGKPNGPAPAPPYE